MADNKPRGREKHVTGQGSVNKHGSGIGGGPAGSGKGYSGRPGTGSSDRAPGSGVPSGTRGTFGNGASYGTRSLSKGKIIIIAIVIIIFLLLGGGKIIKNLLSGIGSGSGISSYLQNFESSSTSYGWSSESNSGKLIETVAPGSREKRAVINGDGTDKVTVMVYMCGTDLESKSGMATNDLSEMAAADLSDNVNIIVYTGGCTQWKTKGISTQNNQIYRVKKNGLELLESDMGNVAMTKPSTLTTFIEWCANHYEANRYELIFWDHGGGSLSGYGYDEKFSSSGSMTLSGINTALKNANVKFDFIGFDACLMATAENALMLSQYADYLIASEETEPGIGWYYTNWISELSENPGMSTLEIGKKIADDFTETCASRLNGAKTTLSVIDLAELETTLPDGLGDFASSTTELIEQNDYQKVSDARSGSREFSTSKIDQVDLVDLATRIGTSESKALANIIKNAVKYNRTSSNMTNSYGLSIYFPYRKISNVDSAVATYEALDINDEYADCIKRFASMEVAGQVTSGGSSSPLTSLLGGSLISQTESSSSSASGISSLLSGFLGGSSGIDIGGLGSSAFGFLSELNTGKAASYIAENHLNASDFEFKYNKKGEKVIYLTDEKWNLVQNIELNVFVDDGEGFIDLGLDTDFKYSEDGGLLGEYEGTWLGINGQPVAYYHMYSVFYEKNYSITGRIPCLYNGERAELIVEFTNDNPYGSVKELRFTYEGSDVSTVAKSIDTIEAGSEIKFICDYYSYGGEYLDSYKIGEKITVNSLSELSISDLELTNDKLSAVYRITDIYGQIFWTSEMD